jgi:hypothetical protein
MANTIYNRFFNDIMKGEMDLDASDSIKVGLLKSAYTIDKDHDVWTDVSANEVAGAGYSAGGKALTTPTVTQDDANDRAYFDAADITWASATLTGVNAPRYAIVYNDTHATDDLICVIDFGADKPCDGGDFEILWDATGIVRLYQA